MKVKEFDEKVQNLENQINELEFDFERLNIKRSRVINGKISALIRVCSSNIGHLNDAVAELLDSIEADKDN